jgi:ASCH domain
MKAISIRQPWAALIVSGVKDIENRSWRTSHRGPVLIHASQNVAGWSLADIEHTYGFSIPPDVERLYALRGGIVGTASIVDCVDAHASKWFDGPIDSNGRPNYGFALRDARELPFRRMAGRLGLFEVCDALVSLPD